MILNAIATLGRDGRMPPLENIVVELLDASTVEAKQMRMAMSVVELVERISGLE
jgi:hypothetical protein